MYGRTIVMAAGPNSFRELCSEVTIGGSIPSRSIRRAMNNCENCENEKWFSERLGIVLLVLFSISMTFFTIGAISMKDLERRAVKAENKVKTLEREIRNIPWSQW